MRAYVIKTNYTKHPDYAKFWAGRKYRKLHKKAEIIIKGLKKKGHKTVDPSDKAFAGGSYDDVYRSIEACDFTLAFTDGLTFAETRRATELTHSIMVAGSPVFLFTALDDNYETSALFKGLCDIPGVIVLPPKAKSAVNSILTTSFRN